MPRVADLDRHLRVELKFSTGSCHDVLRLALCAELLSRRFVTERVVLQRGELRAVVLLRRSPEGAPADASLFELAASTQRSIDALLASPGTVGLIARCLVALKDSGPEDLVHTLELIETFRYLEDPKLAPPPAG